MRRVIRATPPVDAPVHRLDVSLKVALVSRDNDARLALVKAFDDAPTSWLLSLHHEAPADADVLVCGSDVHIDGAVAFDPSAPDDVLERVREHALPAGRAVIVTSPSGGTGVTSIVIHAAAEMAARGYTTCVVDLDGEWGIRHRLGLDGDVVAPEVAVPVAGGFRLLDARSVSSDDRSGVLSSAAESFERVIIDATVGGLGYVGDAVRRAVLVVSPTPEGARRAAVVLETHLSFDWIVVVNRPGAGGETTRSAIARTIGRPVEIELSCCPGLRDSEDGFRLLARGWSRWSRGIARLVSALER
jgi:hypothetical protein